MHRPMLLALLVVVLLSVGGTGADPLMPIQCLYSPMPCGCYYDMCPQGQYWTECCCVTPPCNNWCGCQPWGYNCAESWGGCS